jgi:hypothetical protein
MEWPQTYFEIIYKLVREQNKILLKDIANNECISHNELIKNYLPSKKYLKQFINTHTTSSTSSSS